MKAQAKVIHNKNMLSFKEPEYQVYVSLGSKEMKQSSWIDMVQPGGQGTEELVED